MVNCEVNIRNEFFISALFADNMITTYLSEKLKVNDILNSNFSENDNNSINFHEKIEFLLESDYFSIIDNSKLSVFREVYKEFLVNKNVDTFEGCFTSNDSNDDFLLILYPQSDLISREEKLTNACYQLMDDVSELISDFTSKREIKLRKNVFKFTANATAATFSKIAFFFTLLFIR